MQTQAADEVLRSKPQTIAVRSPEFEQGRAIPREFSGHGDDVSPPLAWENVPEETKALAIVVDDSDAAPGGAPSSLSGRHRLAPDAAPGGAPSSLSGRHRLAPDAPKGTFTHWLVWNLPPRERGLPKAAHVRSIGAVEGTNDFGVVGWRGPLPPSGTHRYFFRVFALDAKLDLPEGARADAAWKAIRGHALAWGETMGTFTKP